MQSLSQRIKGSSSREAQEFDKKQGVGPLGQRHGLESVSTVAASVIGRPEEQVHGAEAVRRELKERSNETMRMGAGI